MAASKMKVYGACGLLVLLSTSCSGDDAGVAKAPEVTTYLQEKFAESVAAFGEKLDECYRQAQGNSVPVLDRSKVQRLGASEEQIVVAIGHMNFTNSFNCSRAERTALAFNLEMLTTAGVDQSIKGEDLQEIKKGLIYPSMNEISYSVRYRKVPSGLKEHVESVAGDKPFDLLKALEANRLTND